MHPVPSPRKTAAPLLARLFGPLALRLHDRAERAQRRRERDDILSLPPHLLRDIGYYD